MRKRLHFEYFDNPSAEHYAMAQELRPDVLEPDELEIWDLIMPYLAMAGRLKPIYMHTAIEYCRVVSTINRLSKYLRDKRAEADEKPDNKLSGDTYMSYTRNGTQIKMRPEVGQINEARRMLRSYVGDFGLTPAAEKQLNALQLDMFGADKNQNPFAALTEADEHSYSHTLQ